MKIEKGIIKEIGTYATLKVDLIPKERLRRPGTVLRPKYITIHNTGCPNVKADNFRRCVLDESQDKEVSWHFTIDEKEVIQHLPINEIGWHAGHPKGNSNSFGIEICEREGAEQVAIQFIAELLKALEWNTTHIKTHKYWSGKQCPHLILPHLPQFIEDVNKLMESDKNLIDAVIVLYNHNILTTPRVWGDVKDMKLEYVPGLIKNMGGLDRLIKDRIVTNAEIWQNKMYKPEHVRSLLIKYANTLR